MALPGRVVLVPSSQMEVCPTAISSASGVNILEAPMFHLLCTTNEFSMQRGSFTKFTSRIGVS